MTAKISSSENCLPLAKVSKNLPSGYFFVFFTEPTTPKPEVSSTPVSPTSGDKKKVLSDDDGSHMSDKTKQKAKLEFSMNEKNWSWSSGAKSKPENATLKKNELKV